MTQQVFARRASGLVRDWSVAETTIYNILTITLYGPLLLGVFLTGPGVFPGSSMELAILITVIFASVHACSYAFLGAAMPRSGGEYVFLTRIVGGAFGSTVELGAWVLNMLIGNYWNIWIFTSIGLYTMASTLGYVFGNATLVAFGAYCATTEGLMVIGIIYNIALTCFGAFGPSRNYLRLQWILIVGTIAGFLISVALFASTSPQGFQQAFNAFMLRFQSDSNLYGTIISTAKAQGFQIPSFSIVATLAVTPMAFTQLCWGYWSSWNLGEIKGADRVRTNIITMIGSTWIVGILLIVLGFSMEHSATYEFLGSAGYLTSIGSDVMKAVPMPLYYPILSAILTASPILVFLVAFAVVCNGIQIFFNTAFGFTRPLVSMSLDRVVPDALGRVHPKYVQPVYAWFFLLIGSSAFMVIQNYTAGGQYALNIFYTAVVAFMITNFVAMIFPFRRPAIYNASPIAKWKIGPLPLITLVGLIGGIWNAAMIYYYMTVPQYGLGIYQPSIIFLVGIFIIAFVYYEIRKAYLSARGIDIGLAFAEVPPA